MNPSEPQRDNGQSVTEASNTVLYVIDGPGDTTRRPRRPNIPLFWPEGMPLPRAKPDEKEETDQGK